MQKLKDIPGVGPKISTLLSAAGFEDLEDLLGSSSSEILAHLAEVNRHHQMVTVLPPESQIAEWLERANRVREELDNQGVNYEEDPDVASMIELAPVAIPVSGKMLMEARVSPELISEPIFLNNVRKDIEVRLLQRPTTRRGSAPLIERHGSVAPLEEPEVTVDRDALGIDRSRVKSVDDVMTDADRERVAKVNAAESKDRDSRVKLLTTARRETNVGKNPKSRRFIRGVLHPLPGRMYAGSFFSMMSIIFLPLAILTGLAILVNDVYNRDPLPSWLLIIPVLLPVFGIGYLFTAPGCRCRVCGQKIFLPKQCLKHRNAHRIPFIGYILPTALHILSFKWFRCIFCGTPIRLKE